MSLNLSAEPQAADIVAHAVVPAIETVGLRKAYRGTVVLHDLSLAVAPVGNRAYAHVLHRARQSAIVEIDLASGASHTLVLLPGESLGNLVVTEEHVYAPHTMGDEVWVIDRQRGRLVSSIRVGRHPMHLFMAQS